jgi:hypothetical protein
MGALLGRRRGKPTAAGIDRGWPHQVVVPATECTSSHGRFMEAFRLDLSVCERHHSVFHEDKWWIVYCFADPEHAKKFRVRFAANGSIRKIEAAAPAGRGGTRMDAERPTVVRCRRLHYHLPFHCFQPASNSAFPVRRERRGRRWKKCLRDRRANDQVSSSVALTPRGKGFASDETRFPAYETRLKQSACIVVLGSVLTKSLPGHSPKPLPWAWTS